MGRPRKFDAQEVLAAARDQFWAKGYAATSVDDLTAATGLGKGSLYGAFGDKRQLFLAVLADYSAGRLEAMRKALSCDRPAIERLRGLFQQEPAKGAKQKGGAGQGAACRGCLLVNSTTELAPHDADVVKQARDAFGAVEEMLAAAAQEAREAGDLPPETDPRELARLLLAIMQGQEFLAKSGMAPAALAQIGQATVAKLLGGPPAREGTKARRRAPAGVDPHR